MSTVVPATDLSDFIYNRDPRCPCVLLVDCSGSMGGPPIEALNAGLQDFKRTLGADTLANKRVEPIVIAFGDDVRAMGEFTTADQFEAPILRAAGSTPIAAAIQLGMQLLEERKATYRAAQVPSYRPWMFLITDGMPTDTPDAIETARAQLLAACNAKKLAFFGVAVTDEAMPFLNTLGTRAPMRLKGLAFQELFVWLSGSLKSVSSSTPGDAVPLTKPDSWAEV